MQIRTKPYWAFMLCFGLVGLLASFVLSVEKIHLLQNPAAQLSCNFNAVLNCASVMKTAQASVFGFPNSFIGLMGFSVVVTVAVAGLSGAVFSKKFLLAAQICFFLGLVFAYWLFFQSVYVIQVLCPWCLVVTVVTTLLFETLLRYNLLQNSFLFAPRLHQKIQSWLQKDYDKFATAAWLVCMTALVLMQFREALFG